MITTSFSSFLDFLVLKAQKTYPQQFQIMVAFYEKRNKDISIARPKSKVFVRIQSYLLFREKLKYS